MIPVEDTMINLHNRIKDKIKAKWIKNSSIKNYIIIEKPVNEE